MTSFHATRNQDRFENYEGLAKIALYLANTKSFWSIFVVAILGMVCGLGQWQLSICTFVFCCDILVVRKRIESQILRQLCGKEYVRICGWALARAYAKAGDASTTIGYLGGGEPFEDAMASFSLAYADQVEPDFDTLKAAAVSGRISVSTDPKLHAAPADANMESGSRKIGIFGKS